MNLYDTIDGFMASMANFLWGTPLVILLLGGGFYFSIVSRLVPFAYLRHAIDILLGKYDSEDDPGQITHFEALSINLLKLFIGTDISYLMDPPSGF